MPADGPARAVAIPRFDWPFSPRLITGWTALDDYPDYQEEDKRRHHIVLSRAEWDALVEVGFPQGGDKLGGWPAWVQGVEYPSCPDCGETMRLLFQIDSQDHIAYLWGNGGRGHIAQCARHPHRLAFGWACG